jgi:hypothetical protein
MQPVFLDLLKEARTLDINDNFGMASNALAGTRPARLAAQEMAGIRFLARLKPMAIGAQDGRQHNHL